MKTIKLTTCILLFTLSFINVMGQARAPQYSDSSSFPTDSEGGKVIKKLLSAINSKDSQQATQFIEKHIDKKAPVPVPDYYEQFFSHFQEVGGGAIFQTTRKYTQPRGEFMTFFTLKDKNYELLWGVGLKFKTEKREVIERVLFGPASPLANVKPSKISKKEFLKEVEKLMSRLAKNDVFSGSMLIANGDEVLYKKAVGEASKRFHVPNRIDTKFNLGSMNKMFTALSIMQLVEQGKLKTNDFISKYIDESWLPKSITDKVRIHHLLTHRSGLGSYFNDTFLNSSRDLYRKVDDYKSLVKDETLAFEPGSRFQYSNTGMLLLGVIIEKITSKSYFDYIRNHIYKPAKMENTDSYDMDQPVENLAIGYIPSDNKYGWENNIFKHVMKGGPAGGGFSTVEDLFKFSQALLKEKLVSKSTLNLMLENYSKEERRGYGYGFSLGQGSAGKHWGHAGGFEGLNSRLAIYPDLGKEPYIVAVMSNYDLGEQYVSIKIMELLSTIK